MSGGHFEYKQYEINQIAESIQSDLLRMGKPIPEDDLKYYYGDTHFDDYSDETKKRFKEAIHYLTLAYIYVQRIDWFMSGDDGEESFLKQLSDELEKLEEQIMNIYDEFNYYHEGTSSSTLYYCDRCGRILRGSYLDVGGMKICGVCQWEQKLEEQIMANYDCNKCKELDHNSFCHFWDDWVDPDDPLEDDCEGYDEKNTQQQEV